MGAACGRVAPRLAATRVAMRLRLITVAAASSCSCISRVRRHLARLAPWRLSRAITPSPCAWRLHAASGSIGVRAPAGQAARSRSCRHHRAADHPDLPASSPGLTANAASAIPTARCPPGMDGSGPGRPRWTLVDLFMWDLNNSPSIGARPSRRRGRVGGDGLTPVARQTRSVLADFADRRQPAPAVRPGSCLCRRW